MRPMRRSDRATTPENAWEILENAEFMTLSMMGAEGVPYGVTLSFARVGNALYFHCANEGYKLDSTKKEFTVTVGQTTALQVTNERSPVPEVFSGTFMVWGTLCIILAFVLEIVISVVYLKKDIQVKYKDMSMYLLSYEERKKLQEEETEEAEVKAEA